MMKTTSYDEMLNLYRELQYINLPAHRTLFRCGDIGKNFYIILRGSVWVIIKYKIRYWWVEVDQEMRDQKSKIRKQIKNIIETKKRNMKLEENWMKEKTQYNIYIY